MAGTYQVIITPDAEEDLLEILDSVAENKSASKVEKVREDILNAIDRLEEMPEANAPVRETYELMGNHFRRILADKYRIVFTIEEINL